MYRSVLLMVVAGENPSRIYGNAVLSQHYLNWGITFSVSWRMERSTISSGICPP